jgi:hypothetical protein
MLVRVTPSEHTDRLIESLREGDCLIHRVSRDMFSVFHLYARDTREARVELGLFLRAWALRHAPACAALVGDEGR